MAVYPSAPPKNKIALALLMPLASTLEMVGLIDCPVSLQTRSLFNHTLVYKPLFDSHSEYRGFMADERLNCRWKPL